WRTWQALPLHDMKTSSNPRKATQPASGKSPARRQAEADKRKKVIARKRNLKPSAKAQIREGRGFPIVGIGASAGGFEAFTHLLEHLPADSGMAYVFVQHLQSAHKSK